VNSKMKTLAAENSKMKEEIDNQRSRIEKIEKKNWDSNTDRNLNAIIYGIEGEYYNTVLEQIITILRGIDIDISKYCVKNIFKIGKKRWNEEGPIRVTFLSNVLRNDVMKNKFKLKNHHVGITIREDLSNEDRETRKLLSKFSLEAKNKGKKVYMRNNKLIIEGKAWTLEDLQNNPENDLQNEEELEMEEDAADIENLSKVDVSNQGKNSRKRTLTGSPSNAQDILRTPKLKKGKPEKKVNDGSQKSIRDMWTKTTASGMQTPPPLPLPPPQPTSSQNKTIGNNGTNQ
ncbi:hypothetical protein WDU94_003618, partial [Cyamophila willieti]